MLILNLFVKLLNYVVGTFNPWVGFGRASKETKSQRKWCNLGPSWLFCSVYSGGWGAGGGAWPSVVAVVDVDSEPVPGVMAVAAW